MKREPPAWVAPEAAAPWVLRPGDLPLDMFGAGIRDGGPGAGTTASAGGGADSANYATFAEMAEAYASDVEEVYAGDKYGKNIVSLYNPLNYIGAEGTDDPTWTRVVMGAVEGDMPMMASLNLQLAWLNAGVDAVIEWQWDGGHVPSETLGESLSLYVDQMYGKHEGGKAIEKPPRRPSPRTETVPSPRARISAAGWTAAIPARCPSLWPMCWPTGTVGPARQSPAST